MSDSPAAGAAASSANPGPSVVVAPAGSVTAGPGAPPPLIVYPTGGIALGDGYAATGGVAAAARADSMESSALLGPRVADRAVKPHELSSQFGNVGASLDAGTGTGTLSGFGPGATITSASATGTGTTAGSPTAGLTTGSYTSMAGGTYTYTSGTTLHSGGGEPAAASAPLNGSAKPAAGAPLVNGGNIYISGGADGNNIIGGAQNLFVGVNGAGTPVNVSWSYDGTPVMYQVNGQTVPNPGTANQFTNTPYPISYQSNDSINFDWGEKIGVGTITVNADVLIGEELVPAKPATLTVYVCSPGVSGAVHAAQGVIPQQVPDGTYMVFRDAQSAGVDWSKLTPTKGTGTFHVVQLITSGSLTIAGPKNGTGFYHVDTTVNPPIYTPATFPLIDLLTGATSPFYEVSAGGPTDSPRTVVGAGYTITYAMNCKDYLMYQPPNGIWVPEGTFKWTMKMVCTALTGGAVNLSLPTKPTKADLTVAIDHSAWPSGWTGLSGDYQGFKKS